MRVLLLGNMQSNFIYWLQKIYWRVTLLFKHDRKRYLSLYHHLGIMAKDTLYYDVALSHKSKSIHINGRRMNNERLEFLGDAVLSMVVADYLFKHYQHAHESMLTSSRAKIVNRQHLNKTALEMNIEKMMRKDTTLFSLQSNVYGNSLEALIGAIYMDRGYKTSYQYIYKHIIKSPEYLDSLIQKETNYKARLLEWCQKNKKAYRYEVVSEKLDAYFQSIFEVQILINDEPFGQGTGHSKKEAEQHAAEEAMKRIDSL